MTREFCAECGTHLVTRRPGLPAVVLKIGTLDDPTQFGTPKIGDLHRATSRNFTQIPAGMPSLTKLPPRKS